MPTSSSYLASPHHHHYHHQHNHFSHFQFSHFPISPQFLLVVTWLMSCAFRYVREEGKKNFFFGSFTTQLRTRCKQRYVGYKLLSTSFFSLSLSLAYSLTSFMPWSAFSTIFKVINVSSYFHLLYVILLLFRVYIFCY
jgi:hypothetical protein